VFAEGGKKGGLLLMTAPIEGVHGGKKRGREKGPFLRRKHTEIGEGRISYVHIKKLHRNLQTQI